MEIQLMRQLVLACFLVATPALAETPASRPDPAAKVMMTYGQFTTAVEAAQAQGAFQAGFQCKYPALKNFVTEIDNQAKIAPNK